MKTSVISCLTPPSLVEMELSMTPRTISLGTKCANDHMARCARLTVLPSSWISRICEVTGTRLGSASV